MKQKYLGFLIILCYFVLRIVGDVFLWSKINPYFSYSFEVLFVAGVMVLFRKRRPWFLLPHKHDVSLSLVLFVAGSMTYLLAGTLGLGVPYDLNSNTTIFFLLLVAPILEELIFRVALWDSFKAISDQALLPILGSTLLFSLGHMAAYWVVPSSIQPFVLYQALYVIPLSLVISYRRHYSQSALSAIIIHFAFNLGFFLISKI